MIKSIVAVAVLLAFTLPFNAQAAEQSGGTMQMGIRPGITLADGVPAHDIVSGGIFGRYRLNDTWLVGFAFDYAKYDFENPIHRLNLVTSGTFDAATTEYTISAWAEREFHVQSGSFTPFVGAGLGIGIVDVDDVTDSGGTFYITTDAGTEIIPSVLGGVRFPLGKTMFAEVAVHIDYRFTTWDVRDTVSGNTGTVGNYLTYGSFVGIGWHF